MSPVSVTERWEQSLTVVISHRRLAVIDRVSSFSIGICGMEANVSEDPGTEPDTRVPSMQQLPPKGTGWRCTWLLRQA